MALGAKMNLEAHLNSIPLPPQLHAVCRAFTFLLVEHKKHRSSRKWNLLKHFMHLFTILNFMNEKMKTWDAYDHLMNLFIEFDSTSFQPHKFNLGRKKIVPKIEQNHWRQFVGVWDLLFLENWHCPFHLRQNDYFFAK